MRTKQRRARARRNRIIAALPLHREAAAQLRGERGPYRLTFDDLAAFNALRPAERAACERIADAVVRLVPACRVRVWTRGADGQERASSHQWSTVRGAIDG